MPHFLLTVTHEMVYGVPPAFYALMSRSDPTHSRIVSYLVVADAGLLYTYIVHSRLLQPISTANGRYRLFYHLCSFIVLLQFIPRLTRAVTKFNSRTLKFPARFSLKKTHFHASRIIHYNSLYSSYLPVFDDDSNTNFFYLVHSAFRLNVFWFSMSL